MLVEPRNLGQMASGVRLHRRHVLLESSDSFECLASWLTRKPLISKVSVRYNAARSKECTIFPNRTAAAIGKRSPKDGTQKNNQLAVATPDKRE